MDTRRSNKPVRSGKDGIYCPLGLCESEPMHFGFAKAPGTFQRAMDNVLGLVLKQCFIYPDEVAVDGRSISEPILKSTEQLRSFLAVAS